MQNSIFSWIRKQQFTLQIFVAVMGNLMAFAQPLNYALNSNSNAPIVASGNDYRLSQFIDFNQNTISNGFSDYLKPFANKTTQSLTSVVKNNIINTTTAVVESVDADIIPSIEKQGIIGKSENLPIDELTDNIFSFELKSEVKKDKDVYLEYELFGLADGSQAIKSINDQTATGGSIIKTTKEWTKVKEKVNPSDIQKGKNSIKFTTWEQSRYQYMVRNLKLVYEDKAIEMPIEFHQTTAKSYSGTIAVSGFIADQSVTKVTILEKDYPVISGVFEALVEEKEPKSNLSVSYIDSKANKIENYIKVEQLLDKPTELHKENKTLASVSKFFAKSAKNSLTFGGAKLQVDTLSLDANQKISIAGLRYIDLPTLSPEMVNVTADYYGYRMLPHGDLFSKKPAKIFLKYDQNKLPTGYTAKDIKTFYFDNDQKRWMALEKDTVLDSSNEIVSKTNHFTDFINGIIKVPESPETGSFTPTSIKDIKAAEPTAGVVSIAPPTPNNMGTVNTSFPIKLPAGRSGMQPSLSVNYSSESGNGWMGLGWDLSIPGVSLDTRWGAPRYDGTNETEIYSMGGGMLTLQHGVDPITNLPLFTNPHRTDGIQRTEHTVNNQKQFYPRIEGSYAKIIRHGNNPNNYWWEVTDKMGNKSFYGGYGSAVEPNAVVKTSSGNIAYWGLYKTEDTNGNYVEYIYHNENLAAGLAPGDGGNEFYIKEIKYTMHKTVDQPNFYKVDFLRNVGRVDTQINARNGVVQVTKDLLSRINIGLQQDGVLKPIRSYGFNYEEHVFNKNQLTKISEFDADGGLFYSNTMEYEKNGNNGNIGSGNDTQIVTNGDFITSSAAIRNSSEDTPFIGNQEGDLLVLADPVSVLGSSEMGGYNYGGYAGAGLCSGSNWLTGGINYGGSNSSGGSLATFMDVNGDNLPDKLFKTEDEEVKYIPNLGNLRFSSQAAKLGNFFNIQRNSADSDSFGGSASFGVTLGGTYNTSKNVTSTYLTDTNGDGLVDLVDEGNVRFNETNRNIYNTTTSSNAPSINFNFEAGSTNTQNTIANGSFNFGTNPGQIQISNETREELQDKNPLHDAVRLWIAPRDGNISITSIAKLAPQLIPPSLAFPIQINDQFYSDYDGVRLSVQLENNLLSPLQGHLLQPTFIDNVGTPNATNVSINFPNIPITRGQRIFFRVQANQEGTFDRVEWNPDIQYLGAIPTNLQGINVDNIPYFDSNSEGGFIVSKNDNVVIPPDVTNIAITWPTLASINLSDVVTFTIDRGTIDNTTGVFTVSASFIGSVNQTQTLNQLNNPGVFDGPVTAGNVYRFSVTSNSNVDWKAINWMPKITCTSPTGTSNIYPVVNYGIFNRKVNVATSKVTNINPAFPVYLRPEINLTPSSLTFDVRLVVKNSNKVVIANQNYTITSGIAPLLNDIVLSTELTNTIFVEYYTDSIEASNFIQNNPNAVRARIGQILSPQAPPTPILPTTTNALSIRISQVRLQNIIPTTGNFTSAYYFNNTTISNTPNIFTTFPLNPLTIGVNLTTNGHAAIWVDLNRDNIIDLNEFSASTALNTVHNLSINIPSTFFVGLHNVRILGGSAVPYVLANLNLLPNGFNNLINTTIRNYQINLVTPVAGNNPVNDVYCKVGNNVFGTMYRNWGQFAYHGGIIIQRGVPLFRDVDGNISTIQTPTSTPVGGVGVNTQQEIRFPVIPINIIQNYGYAGANINPISIAVINNEISGTLNTGQQNCIDIYNASGQTSADQQALADCMSTLTENITNKRFHSLAPVYDMQSNNWTWQGITEKIKIEPQHLSTSRLGVPNINKIFVSTPVSINQAPTVECQFPRVNAVPIIKKGEGFSVSVGLNFGPVGIGGDRSTSFNWTELTAMDMNGDRYPDVLTRNNIRYTNALGALSFDVGNNLERVTRDRTESWGATASGTFKRAVTKEGMGFSVGKDAPKPTGSPTSDSSIGGGASWGRDFSLGFFMDINADGLPDRIDVSDGNILVNLNLGYDFGPTQNWLSGYILESNSENVNGGLGFSYGANAYGGGVSVSNSSAVTTSNFMDMNGDGFPDLIFNGNQYLLNTGSGFAGSGFVNTALESVTNQESLSITATIPICFIFVQVNLTGSGGANNTHSFDRSSYQDINGDGYPDILNADTNNTNEPGKFHNIFLSRIGNVNALKKVHTPLGGTWEVSYLRDGNTFDMPQSKWNMNRVAIFDGFTIDNTWAPDRTITSVQYLKPYQDRREREFYGYQTVRVNQHEGYNTAINIDDLSATLPAIYRYSVQEFHNNNYYLKGALKKESLYQDANGLPVVITPTTSTLFESGDINWTESKTTYGIYQPGSVLTESYTQGINGFTTTNYSIANVNPDVVSFGISGKPVTNTSTNINFICTDLDRGSLFVTPLVSVKTFTEGGTGLKYAVTAMETIDAFGNITQYRDYGEQTNDVYVSKISYNTSVSGIPYSPGYPEYVRVFDANGTTLKRERKATYDANGNLSGVVTKLNGTENASVTMEYDPTYGNLSRVTNENSINTANGSRFFKQYTYDDVLNTFPVRVEDAFGYFSTSSYNYLFGIPVYTTDMNLQPMRTRIDDRGRPIEITGPYELYLEGILGGAEPAWTIRFEYQNETPVATSVVNYTSDQFGSDPVATFNGLVPANDNFQPTGNINNNTHHALTRHFDPEYRTGGYDSENVTTTNQILTATIVDGFGKPVQVKKSSAIFDGSATVSATVNPLNDNNLVWLLNGKAKTDEFGRAIKSYYPTTQTDTFTGAASDFPANAFTYDNTSDNIEPTEATYDVLDRSLTTKLPGETDQTTMAYSIDGNRFATVVTNELNQVQKSFTDVRGRTTQTLQESTTGDIATSFVYNNIGELQTVTDVAGNVTLSSYDLAGRRTELRHPDNGITKFKYDQASNLIKRETANLLHAAANESIDYKYTYNRLDEIKYPQFPENNVHYYYGTSGNSDAANDNVVGRLWYHVDASGTQYFKYGKLGELTKNRRSIAVPGDRVYWFQTDWTYDTWNRVKTIKYPDEELVTYKYNRGGELHAMTSEKNSTPGKDIISQLGYDKFGQRTYLRYGNGTETTYDYQAERRRLDKMKVQFNNSFVTPSGGVPVGANRTFINDRYVYDVLSNVKGIYNNTVALPTNTQIGGRSWQEYTYDDLNRMTTAAGTSLGRNEDGVGFNHNKYTLAMSYDSQHNITSKTQVHDTATGTSSTPVAGAWSKTEQTTYELDYQNYNSAGMTVAGYAYQQPHAPRTIIDQPVVTGATLASDDPRIKTKNYEYDYNGNQTKINQTVCAAPVPELLRENLWDEENRLRAIDLNPSSPSFGGGGGGGVHPISIYTYDAGGERIIKQNSATVTIYENAKNVGSTIKSDFMLYPSGMVVARPAADGTGAMSYTKHYFAGSQRVSSKIGTTTNLGKFLQEWTLQENSSGGAAINLVATSQDQLIKAQTGVTHVYTAFGITPSPTFNTNTAFSPVESFTGAVPESEQYFFHPDHLGSSNYITNLAGDVSQHMEYFAFGETFVEEHKNSINSPYKFNGKELDEESGLYYYGARYYDTRISIWASVDPLANFNPFMDDEHYINGDHNGGVENSFNHASYSYCYQNPIRYEDPNGKQNVAAALGGAILGGIIGGGIEAARQYLKYGEVRDWKMVGGSAAQGAIVGGVAGFTNGASLLVTATSAGAANAVGGTANRMINGKETKVSDIAIDFGTGFAIAGIFGKFSGLLKNSGFKEAGKYGFGSYTALKASVLSKVGKGSGLEVHHLIEKRFAALFGEKAKDMVSIVLTKEEHRIFTNAWSKIIGKDNAVNTVKTTSTATKDDVINAAKEIYKNHPAILKALGIK